MPDSVQPEAANTADVVSRLWQAGCVFAEDEAALLVAHSSETGAALDTLVARRCAGEPLEYIVGWASFRDLRIAVAPGVFVPRHRSEYLAETAIIFARSAGHRPVVVDLCCGSGAIAAAVHAQLPAAQLHATDLDPAAVDCAQRNLGAAAHIYTGDLYTPLPHTLRGRVDVIVANAPYVPTEEIGRMPPEARDHEHRVALDGGSDGLAVARRVFDGAPQWLAPGGTVLVELSAAQALNLSDAVAALGLAVHVIHHDEYEETILAGTAAHRRHRWWERR